MKRIFAVVFVVLCLVGLSNAQSKISIGINGNTDIPLGNFGTSFKTGFGGSVLGLYDVAPQVKISLTAGYVAWSLKSITGLLGASTTGTLGSIPILVGVRYMLMKPMMTGIQPYVAGELGVQLMNSKVTVAVPNYGSVSTTTNKSYFGYALGVGAIYPVSNKVNIDLNVKFNGISSGSSSVSGSSATNFIGINLGVNMAI
jgi:outer membrane protein W